MSSPTRPYRSSGRVLALRRRPITSLTTHLLAALTLVAVGAFGFGVGCDKGATEPDASYVVRGRVRGIAHTAPPRLSVQHEAIEDFVSREGEVVGMPAMVMEFDVAEDVSLDGLVIDEVVEVAFDVRWSGGSMLTITRITKLPPSTPLTFEGGH